MRRREEILRVVRAQAVHSQDELLALLRTRGFAVTQPTLSRDLRELGVIKTPAGYVSPDDLAPVAHLVTRESRSHRLEQMLADSIVSAEAAMNLVVLRTPPAAAQPVASAIDDADIDDLLGTVGGDDTIFLAFRSPSSAAAFARRVHSTAGLTPARRTRA